MQDDGYESVFIILHAVVAWPVPFGEETFFFSVYFWLVVKKRDTHRCLSLQYDSTDECVSLYANITPLLLTQLCNTT